MLTAGEYKLIKLSENDYALDYGTNIVAGKNKGSVTVKFQIEKKAIYTNF